MEFLTSITPVEALRLIASFPLKPPKAEDVALEHALSRVLAADIIAREDVPAFARSLVDGYAVKVKETYGAREGAPAFLLVAGEVPVGVATDKAVRDGQSVYVATGAMIPEGADGVVMLEHARRAGDAIEITRAITRGENICNRGEDVGEGQVVLEEGRTLSPFDLGVLAALGITRVPVYQRPLVGLISSGDEIVPADHMPPPGKVRDINAYTVSALVGRQGCVVRFAGIAADSVDAIVEKLSDLQGCDLILLSGGSSKGMSDFMTAAIGKLGGTILFHGLNIKPGKPTIFASLGEKPVFGLPGHPVSCALVGLRFVLPLVRRMKGERRPPADWAVTGTLTTNVPSSYGIEEYVRVRVEGDAQAARVTPIFAKSAVISTLSRADGYVVIPTGTEGLESGDQVEVLPLG
ncbi:MAG: gephyrin-like molybdotransferase Glp [Syntrophorhabdales bacterium]